MSDLFVIVCIVKGKLSWYQYQSFVAEACKDTCGQSVKVQTVVSVAIE